MIIDSHTHLRLSGEKIFTAQNLLQSMDDAKIDYSIVIAEKTKAYPHGASTEEVIQVAEENPRLKAVGTIDFETVEQSIDTIKNYLQNKKIVGVKLYPGYQDFYPFNEKLFPLYEYCQQNNHPIVFHTGLLEIGYPGLLEQSHPLKIDAVANAFSDLKIIIAHLGNPWIIDCLAVMYKNKNVYTDISAFAPEYITLTQEQKEDIASTVREIKSFSGSFDKCLFGTDWPMYSQKDYLSATQLLSMTEEEKERVLWKNAKEIFRLDV